MGLTCLVRVKTQTDSLDEVWTVSYVYVALTGWDGDCPDEGKGRGVQ